MRSRTAVTAALAAVTLALAGCGGDAEDSVEAGAALTPIADDQLVVATSDRQIHVVDEKGGLVRVLDDGSGLGTGEVQGIDVSPDGRRALVSVLDDHDEACTATVFEATDDGVRKLLDGSMATLDPVGGRLAYLRFEPRGDFCYQTELVVRAADGAETAWPVPGGAGLSGTPPSWAMNWSPTGTRLALSSSDGHTHVFTPARDGAEPTDLDMGRFFAPVFVDDSTLFGSPDCCIRMRFVERDIDRGGTRDVGAVPTATRSARRDRGGTGFWLTMEERGLYRWDGSALQAVGDTPSGEGRPVISSG